MFLVESISLDRVSPCLNRRTSPPYDGAAGRSGARATRRRSATLETFSLSTFSPYIGSRFRLAIDTLPGAELTLASATATGEPRGEHRAPFSLIFRGPPAWILHQGIHTVEHDALGRFELFLVPVGMDAQGVEYQAVFG